MPITRIGTYAQIKGLAYSLPCRVATTGAITLSGTQTIDTIALSAGDRVLVKNQPTPADNGIYIVNAGAWPRAVDMSLDDDVFEGVQIYINQGATNGGKVFYLDTVNPITLNTTSLSFVETTAGTSGTSGTSGSSGTSGTSGTSGSSGTSGTRGTSGTTGTSGTSGTSGINGTSGTSGTSGSSGTSPASQITGTLTTNTIPKATGTNTLGNSNVTDDGTTVSVGANLSVTNQVYSPVNAKGNSGTGTVTFSWNDGNIQTVTLTGSCTFAFSNPQSGASYQIIITQDGTGGRTITWPTIHWEGKATPTLTGTLNSKDIVTFTYDGTNYNGVISKNFGTP